MGRGRRRSQVSRLRLGVEEGGGQPDIFYVHSQKWGTDEQEGWELISQNRPSLSLYEKHN